MILKFDLEKAYDRLEWSFVMSTLICLGIPEELREIIHLCISSGSMRINWNENVSDSFNSSRGLGQGDPISSYLFILCLERLGHRIKDVVLIWNWTPFSFGGGDCPKLSLCALLMILF